MKYSLSVALDEDHPREEAMLQLTAQVEADGMCNRMGIIRTSEPTWRFIPPMEVPGSPGQMTAEVFNVTFEGVEI